MKDQRELEIVVSISAEDPVIHHALMVQHVRKHTGISAEISAEISAGISVGYM